MTWRGRDGTGGPWPPHQETAAAITTTNTSSHRPPAAAAGVCHLIGNRRRYAASRRVPPLWPCGCIRDPAHDRHRCGDRSPSDRWVDAGAAAARLLIERGYTPLLETAVLRALWRRGGNDRALAQYLYDLAGGD